MWQRYNQTTHIFEKSENNGLTWAPLPLNASVLNEGSLSPAVLGPVAYTNVANTFTLVQSVPWLQVGSAAIRSGVGVGGYASAIEAVYPDQSNWATIRAANFVSTASFNNLADLTCGATNFTNGVNVTAGNITCAGAISTARGTQGDITSGWNLFSNAPIYPGRQDTGWTVQTSWYLCSHASYGLYSNTGLYLAGALTVAGGASIGGILTLPCGVWHNSNDGNQRFHFGAGAPTYIQGNGITFRNNSQVDTGTLDNGGNLITGGTIKSGWGYACRAGVYGTYGGNFFNFQWTGAIQCWIDASYFGDITLASDARIKRDFTPLVSSLDKVLQMRPGSFYFLPVSDDPDLNMHLGLLAQDVQKIAPELVRNTGMKTPLTPDGLVQINYLEMIPMLVAAIQELAERK
jgi:hypothetical protein